MDFLRTLPSRARAEALELKSMRGAVHGVLVVPPRRPTTYVADARSRAVASIAPPAGAPRPLRTSGAARGARGGRRPSRRRLIGAGHHVSAGGAAGLGSELSWTRARWPPHRAKRQLNCSRCKISDFICNSNAFYFLHQQSWYRFGVLSHSDPCRSTCRRRFVPNRRLRERLGCALGTDFVDFLV